MIFIVPTVRTFGVTYFVLLRSVKGNAFPGPTHISAPWDEDIREGIALHILKLKCRIMLSMRRFVCKFCYKSIFFFFFPPLPRKEQLGEKSSHCNFFFFWHVIETGEACKKCIVYVTAKLLKLCICANILVTFVAVEECLLCTVYSYGFKCFVLPYNSNH